MPFMHVESTVQNIQVTPYLSQNVNLQFNLLDLIFRNFHNLDGSQLSCSGMSSLQSKKDALP